MPCPDSALGKLQDIGQKMLTKEVQVSREDATPESAPVTEIPFSLGTQVVSCIAPELEYPLTVEKPRTCEEIVSESEKKWLRLSLYPYQ